MILSIVLDDGTRRVPPTFRAVFGVHQFPFLAVVTVSSIVGFPSNSGNSRQISGPSGLKLIVAMNWHTVIEVDFEFTTTEIFFEIFQRGFQSTDPFRQRDRRRAV